MVLKSDTIYSALDFVIRLPTSSPRLDLDDVLLDKWFFSFCWPVVPWFGIYVVLFDPKKEEKKKK